MGQFRLATISYYMPVIGVIMLLLSAKCLLDAL